MSNRRKVTSSNPEHVKQLQALQAAQARQLEHVRAAMAAGKSAQAQVIAKVTDKGELGYKLQGVATDGVKSRAERSEGAVAVFAIVNAQNRQLESMVKYLWALRNAQHEAIVKALEPMAQGHGVVAAEMAQHHTEKALKEMKKAEFTQAVADAMRAVIWG